ncbi:hypothetical protein B484DRAFT_423352, partial [Ochromonadaceae sp. CCMP2298]
MGLIGNLVVGFTMLSVIFRGSALTGKSLSSHYARASVRGVGGMGGMGGYGGAGGVGVGDRSQSLSARKRRSEEDVPEPRTDPGWVTLKLGGKGAEEKARMNDRLDDAERWISKKLTDTESAELNRKLGIEDEVFKAMEAADEEEEEGRGKKGKGGKDKGGKDERGKGRNAKPRPGEGLDGLRGVGKSSEFQHAARLRGFLEVNPVLCSGCGTAFQSKGPDLPGFLPKDKFQEHRVRTALFKQKQEAVRILDMAGMEVDSPAAEELLIAAGVSADVIRGVQALGRGMGLGGDQEQGREEQGRGQGRGKGRGAVEEVQEVEEVGDDYYSQDFEDEE